MAVIADLSRLRMTMGVPCPQPRYPGINGLESPLPGGERACPDSIRGRSSPGRGSGAGITICDVYQGPLPLTPSLSPAGRGSPLLPDRTLVHSPAPLERSAAGKHRLRPQLFLDPDQLVVFRRAVGARQRTGLDLSAIGRDREI